LENYFTLDQYSKYKFPWFRRPPIYLWRILRQYVYERDFGVCAYCGNKVELNKCHIHHVLELSEGGTNHPSNLKVLCKDCHKIKHPFMMDARDKLRLQ
jgi:5-methylcytosine-specific restriction endonuclease McrA